MMTLQFLAVLFVIQKLTVCLRRKRSENLSKRGMDSGHE